MPICPKCGTEYRPGVRRCADCGSTLVEGSLEDQKPQPEDRAGYEQVVLCVVEGEIQARMLQNMLAKEGIPSRLHAAGDPFSLTFLADRGVFPSGTSTLMRVWVNKRDLARAQVVRTAYEGKPK